MSRRQSVLLLLLVSAMLASLIKAPFPDQIWLQHIPTAIGLVLLTTLTRQFPLSDAAFTCIALFMLLRVVGARYTYSYVPYDQWGEWLLGIHLTDYFSFRRNHYDRLVHFAFGVLAILPAWEVCTRHGQLSPWLACFLSFEFVLAVSMIYELLEWALAVLGAAVSVSLLMCVNARRRAEKGGRTE